MFYSLTGRIAAVDPSFIAIDCGGVAYKCSTSLTTLQKLGRVGETATLYTHLSVSENAVELFGFADQQELEFFRMLIDVSGVGPKAATAILSQYACDALAVLIASGDSKSITRAKGVGPKIAQRIVLELQGKMKKLAPASIPSADLRAPAIPAFGGNIPEAVSALAALGFTAADAEQALAGADPSASVESLIKIALKRM